MSGDGAATDKMTRNLRIGVCNQSVIRTNLRRMENRTTKAYFGVNKFPK
jgi:hypothetical protein